MTDFLKLRSALHKQGTILALKQADLLSPFNNQIHPFSLDMVSSQNPDPVTLIRIQVS
jgi:hypothetical protein